MKKIAFIGNCQIGMAKRIFEKISFDIESHYIPASKIRTSENVDTLFRSLHDYDFVLSQPFFSDSFGPFAYSSLESSLETVRFVPQVTFQGYHPDCIYLSGGGIKSPIGDYHSFLAVACFKLGYSVDQTVSAFGKKIYEKLGYFDFFQNDLLRLSSIFKRYDLSVDCDLEELFYSTKMMHTINHPTIKLMAVYLKSILRKFDIPFLDIPVDQYVHDDFIDSALFPVYPEIAGNIGVEGGYFFKAAKTQDSTFKIYSLREFVERSFEIYTGLLPEQLDNPRFTSDNFELVKTGIENVSFANHVQLPHPYRGKLDYCFWKKSISGVESSKVDPVSNLAFRIKKSEKIATAGSCFAQHIARELSGSGYNYYVTEAKPESMQDEEAHSENYGVFSARYGNVYTARQLVQLFDRAFGDYCPSIGAWRRRDGRYVDPFRPQISEAGYEAPENVLSARKEHLAHVRQMFESLDVFVFTLGLTEGWIHNSDGAVLPIAPGVVAGEMDYEKYSFVNFGIDEVSSDMEIFLRKLRSVNPRAKVILTVSPVPLMATFEDRHVLVSTTVSKSVLRVAADVISRNHDFVEYFPSYEIITGNFNRGAYYGEDLREVLPVGVEHVMRLFMKHCTYGDFGQSHETDSDMSDEKNELLQIICDEEALHVD